MKPQRTPTGTIRPYTNDELRALFTAACVERDSGYITPCLEWTRAKNFNGYGHLGHNGNDCMAHRLAWLTFVGAIPDGLEVLHKCDNPPCVRIDHLFLGTKSDNLRDAWGKGKRRFQVPLRGDRNGHTTLTDYDVKVIRTMHRLGVLSCREIAKPFGITRHAVQLIVTRKTWKHI